MSRPITSAPVTAGLVGPLVALALSACGQSAGSASPTPSAAPLVSAAQSTSGTPAEPPTSGQLPANSLLAVAGPGDLGWQVRAVDLATGEEEWRVETEPVNDLRWSPDGAWLAVVEAGSLRMFSEDGATGPTIDGAFSASWSPDSTALAIGKMGGIYLYDLGSRQETQVGPNWHLYGAEWSPDGDSILFTSGAEPFNPTEPPPIEPTVRLYRLSLLDESHLALTDEAYYGGECWSPDGRQIALTRRHGMSFFTDGFVLDVESGGVTGLGAAGWERCPWSPDGQQLLVDSGDAAWIATAGGEPVIEVAAAATGELVLAHGWSPDGEWVLVMRENGAGTPTLEVVRVDGSDRTLVGEGFVAAWQPARAGTTEP